MAAAVKSVSAWFAILVICSIWLLRIPLSGLPGEDDLVLGFIGIILTLAVCFSGMQFMCELISIFRPVAPLPKDDTQPESSE